MITRKLYATSKTGKTNSGGCKIVKLPIMHTEPKVIYKGKTAATLMKNGEPTTTGKIN